jgi:hypothetical protein
LSIRWFYKIINQFQQKYEKETIMVSITDAIKCQVAMQSQEIHRLKAAALETRAVKKYLYISADGKTMRSKRPAPEEVDAGWKLEKITCQQVLRHISPKHPDWNRYRSAKRRASLLLTARLLLKFGAGAVPELSIVRKQLSAPSLQNHARRGQARSLCFAAYRYLRKLSNRLERAPEKFSYVNEWLQNQTDASAGLSAKETHND